jgi:hypothetical protein
MGRSNAEFQGGQRGMVTLYHETPASNRTSIETHGLVVKGLTTHPDTGKANVGVFGSSATGVEQHARPGSDIWEFSTPQAEVARDTWSPDDKDAVKSRTSVPAYQIKRVGHVTPNGHVHWHIEEECSGDSPKKTTEVDARPLNLVKKGNKWVEA